MKKLKLRWLLFRLANTNGITLEPYGSLPDLDLVQRIADLGLPDGKPGLLKAYQKATELRFMLGTMSGVGPGGAGTGNAATTLAEIDKAREFIASCISRLDPSQQAKKAAATPTPKPTAPAEVPPTPSDFRIINGTDAHRAITDTGMFRDTAILSANVLHGPDQLRPAIAVSGTIVCHGCGHSLALHAWFDTTTWPFSRSIRGTTSRCPHCSVEIEVGAGPLNKNEPKQGIGVVAVAATQTANDRARAPQLSVTTVTQAEQLPDNQPRLELK